MAPETPRRTHRVFLVPTAISVPPTAAGVWAASSNVEATRTPMPNVEGLPPKKTRASVPFPTEATHPIKAARVQKRKTFRLHSVRIKGTKVRATLTCTMPVATNRQRRTRRVNALAATDGRSGRFCRGRQATRRQRRPTKREPRGRITPIPSKSRPGCRLTA